jgi:pyruvate/2-oxoglutarate dehydrogenase complex dihydrolipoamide dehydrogenase (E3) component
LDPSCPTGGRGASGAAPNRGAENPHRHPPVSGEIAALAVVAVGWSANTADLDLAAAGVATDERGFVRVDAELRTTAPTVFAAGDVAGRALLVHEAAREGFAAGTNAAGAEAVRLTPAVSPVGSFTNPEYASVGLTEAEGGAAGAVVVETVGFDALPRPIIDGRTTGFCKLVVRRDDGAILGCHIVGERAVELAQLAAVAISAGMRVDRLAMTPLSFPTYANALGRAAILAARQLDPTIGPTNADV